MSDRGPSGQDPDPTELFPPLPPDAAPTGPTVLPPIGSERDPDPTRVMPPAGGPFEPTTVIPPSGGGPVDPGPPYGGGGSGGPGGPGGPGGDEPEFNEEPVPWYRQPGPVAALIAGIAALVLGLIALLVWTSDDDDTTDDTLPAISTSTTSAPATTEATIPPTTTTTSVPDTTTSTTSTTTTTSVPETTTTTTLPPTTTTEAPATTTTVPVTAPPIPGATLWDIISATPSLSQFRDAIDGSDTVDLFDGTDEITVLAPDNAAFAGFTGSFDVNDYVIAGKLTSAELFALDQIDVESGATLAVDDAAQTVGGAVMTSSRDVEAANGYLNVLSGLVTPDS
jgi:uncharacterized surface protein with fasciclin (FAS1) repeats